MDIILSNHNNLYSVSKSITSHVQQLIVYKTVQVVINYRIINIAACHRMIKSSVTYSRVLPVVESRDDSIEEFAKKTQKRISAALGVSHTNCTQDTIKEWRNRMYE